MSAITSRPALAALICAISLGVPFGGLPLAGTAHAQEAVVAAPDAEALFTSPDPKLHANKQVVYRIIRELLEANHWTRPMNCSASAIFSIIPMSHPAGHLSSRSSRKS